MTLHFFEEAETIMKDLEDTQKQNISEAAQLISASIQKGGILQAFGSGHSYAGAIEICGRAGGLIPSKVIKEPAEGIYEAIEGVGTALMKKVRVDPEDVVVLISNSGRNPLIIEIAETIKENGNKLIVVTALDISKSSTSRHSSGKLLYEYADVVLDNRSKFGDAALTVEGLKTSVCGTSSLSTVLLLQQVMYEAISDMVEKGYNPPVYQSANIDGGREYNEALESQYGDRIWHM